MSYSPLDFDTSSRSIKMAFPYGLILVTTSSAIAFYPQVREGGRVVWKDATSAYKYIEQLLTGSPQRANISTGADSTAFTPPSVLLSNDTVDIAARIQNLFSSITIAIEILKIYQAEQIRQELKGISDQIRIYNNLVAGGGGGPDGFARHVLDFINLKIAEYTADGKAHRFFVYHPDTHWHGAFSRIRQESGFAQQSFLGLSHDLFAVFRLMLCTRVALEETMGENAKNIIFHLLIPSYSDLPEISWKKAAIGASYVGAITTFTAATVAVGQIATTAVCPPLGAALICNTVFASGFVAGGLVATRVESMWDEPPPALLGADLPNITVNKNPLLHGIQDVVLNRSTFGDSQACEQNFMSRRLRVYLLAVLQRRCDSFALPVSTSPSTSMLCLTDKRAFSIRDGSESII
ncbi:hypothetical protein B7463_g5197, partial [Scytalidium lignicola]